MDYFNAFWFGGLVCALIQILLDKTKLMPGRVLRPADRFRTCIMGGYEKSH